MPLPYELTTFPEAALDILRFLLTCDNHAAFDGEIVEGLDLSDRSFGKAIRRLVTKEYVEMQYDGTYALTERGLHGAEALVAHDEAGGEITYAAEEEDVSDEFEEEAIEIEEMAEATFARRLIVALPKAVPVGQPFYLFVRVDAPHSDDELLPDVVEMAFRLQTDCAVTPAQHDLTLLPDEASDAARFEVMAPAAGTHALTVQAFQGSDVERVEVGAFAVTAQADEAAAPAGAFQVHYFELALAALV